LKLLCQLSFEGIGGGLAFAITEAEGTVGVAPALFRSRRLCCRLLAARFFSAYLLKQWE